MAFDAWSTVTIPIRMVRGSYSETMERWVDSFEPEQGPPIEGVSGSVSTDLVSWDQLSTWTEFGSLKTLYRTTLNNGTEYFTLTNPLNGASETFQFIEPPQGQVIPAKFKADNATEKARITYIVSIRLRRFN
jgi:hypothetical protein